MFDKLLYVLSGFWEGFDWFGLSDSQLVMGSLEFALLLLGNNAFMVLVVFYLASKWGADNERRKFEALLADADNAPLKVNMGRRIL